MKSIYFIFFIVFMGIFIRLGFADIGTENEQNESLINLDSNENPSTNTTSMINEIPSINATPEIYQLQGDTTSNTIISGWISTCTNSDGKQIVDLKISNNDSVNRSVTIYPMRNEIKMLPKYKMSMYIVIQTGIKTLTLVSDNREEVKLSVPPCTGGGYSGQDYFGSGPERSMSYNDPESTTKPGPTTIPEFPSIIAPVIAVLGLLFITQRKK